MIEKEESLIDNELKIKNSTKPKFENKNSKESNDHSNYYVVFMNNNLLNDNSTETNKISTSKYEWFNFFPKMLMEQFSRMANAYFLIIAVLQSIKIISYSGGTPVILFPLAFVVSLNGIKDFFEDYKRKKSDNIENNSKILVFDKNKNEFIKKKWKEVKLGDIVKVLNDEHFPADLLLLNSSEKDGICYVETKNIDGETNLKFKQANSKLKQFSETREQINSFSFAITTKMPNEFIYQFNGTVYNVDSKGNLKNKKDYIFVDFNSFLLRGSKLKQTEYIIGSVIYIGPHTKSMINSPKAKSKHSSVEKIMNIQIVSIFCLQILLSFIASLANHFLVEKNKNNLGYIFLEIVNKKKSINDVNEMHTIMGTWILIFTNFVPISLLVTMEIVKFFQGIMMGWDIEMVDKKRFISAKVQASTLNEELGQIKYIFSDKTGTLTKNHMNYKAMSIGLNFYGEIENSVKNDNVIKNNDNILKDNYGDIENVDFKDDNFLNDLKNRNKDDLIDHFLKCLAFCNTVIIDSKKFMKSNLIEYQSSSPDEKALIYFARSVGYIFKNRTIDNEIEIEIDNKTYLYKILNILEYSSERKRMSVIVRTPENKIILYSKGADSMIEKLLKSNLKDSKILIETNKNLKTFANKGLRTLMIAYRILSEEEYNEFNKKYIKISLDVNNKEERLPLLYDEIEINLDLIGATAIEDQLQDNVDDTIESILKTGIKVWMLTGDKMDTAKNIALSCKLFKESMNIIEIEENIKNIDLENKFNNIIHTKNFTDNNIEYGLLISSEEITLIFNNNNLLQLFYKICLRCESVVCSRVSPKQKAEMVSLIKTSNNAITLAIGDGANDVGMITSANVGIGIQGIEGTQAARASDYVITEFQFLKKLLLFHGREAYRRNSFVICYNFYKNVVFVSPMYFLGFLNIFSGQTLYDPWIHQFYNMVYAAVPPVWFGVYDLEYESETLMNNPKYYIQGIYKKLFHYKRFWNFILIGFFEGIIIFFFTFKSFKVDAKFGKTIDFWCYGTVIYALCVILVNLKIAMYTNTHTIISTVFLILSVLTYFITVIIFSHIIIFTITNNDSNIFLDPKYFFTILETIVLIEMFEYVLRKSLIFFGIVEEGEKLKPYKENINFYLNENLTNINKTSSFNSIDLESENELKSINNEIINNNSK